ncbi:voltage-dependent calcium channel subunit alpha-2/delta-1-like isoform X2 [Denticeps clupeoides]|uniref:voltage-dependent calcium channel subunit alpha-2/delta-1-like isoform X2 n=1 Tax=Denticeps clupeoides TaxID=299321 RepID=UPI0010A49412|nr:voltage-dependent calcium channel subunit alpha-2/delta-1-like isoform X2 [Denticeps clupeoides]
MEARRLAAAALLLLCAIGCAAAVQFPTQLVVRDWVERIQKDVVSLIDTETSTDSLVKIFQKHRKRFTVEPNNARMLVSNAASNIEKLLSTRSRALKALVEAAEKAQVQHQWTDNLEAGNISYYNPKDNNETDPVLLQNRTKPDFRADPVFKRHVSFNHTAVHIPTDIYEGSTIVLNELNWTDALQETFKKNREEDPTLLWQVFGSATGLARYYPASPWIDKEKTPNNIDLYDVRRRPWYIQGAASPKDMLILVDASGSVSGLTLKLIRTSVNEMLETLSDDDYVNVVYFNEKAMQAACFGHLVQANVRNKKILKDAVQNISAKGITNYKMGFELAFEQLLSFNMTRANCNKIIMLFTDGGEERASEIFEKYNYHKRVRIFTFSVGQHNYDKAPIQWMACTNKGYYYEIPSIGAIRINTQEYLDVLGRPMVQAKEAQKVQWTNVYLDALELGLVITGTLPVFNKTTIKDENNREKKQQNQLILGVMAIDVSLEDIKRLTPRFTLGPNGYYFAIDPNGYVFLHPNLLPKNPKFQEPVTLDFLDAELEDSNKVQIRTEMIDLRSGSRKFTTLVKSLDEKYIDIGHRTYTWSPVNETDYSLALVLPDYSLHYIHATIGDTITQAKSWIPSEDSEGSDTSGTSVFESLQVENFEENGYTYIAPREYCKDLKPSVNHTEFLMNFTEYIDRNTPNHPMCNDALVNRLLLDAGITSELVKLWTEQSLNEKVAARFVATDGGITRVYPSSAGSDWFELENPETYESSFYKRSLDNDGYIFTPRFSDNDTDTSVLVSRAVHLNVDGINLKPAVVGVKLDIQNWMQSFMNATEKANCKDEICGCRRNDKNVDCVLLDDGGFLVMSNQDDHISRIGEFFGMIDPSLMIELVNTSLFTLTKSYDYQSLCERKTETRAAAGLRSVYVPTIADILNVGWWASAAAWSIMQQLFVSITFPNFLEAAEPDEDLSDAHSKESCITEQTQYYFNDTEGSYSGTMGCDACSRQYLVEKLLKTNLVFIIAEVSCKSCPVSVLSQAEKPSSGPDPCELALNPRYRKGPDVCFDNNASEEDVDCGGVSSLSPSPWVLALLQLALFGLLSGCRHCPS